MKNFIPLFVLLIFLWACQTRENKQSASGIDTSLSFFGDTISADGATAVSELTTRLTGKDSIPVKLEGSIVSVCQNKGCWMELPLSNSQTMRVKFKDYAFFVPKDAAGKKTVIEGWAYNDTTSVEELRHYAEDAGKTKAEIEAITEPEAAVTFIASGVIIRK